MKDTYKMLMTFRETDVKLQCIEAMGNAGLPDHTEILRVSVGWGSLLWGRGWVVARGVEPSRSYLQDVDDIP